MRERERRGERRREGRGIMREAPTIFNRLYLAAAHCSEIGFDANDLSHSRVGKCFSEIAGGPELANLFHIYDYRAGIAFNRPLFATRSSEFVEWANRRRGEREKAVIQRFCQSASEASSKILRRPRI